MAIKIRVKLVPRLREAGMSQNEIARSQGMSRHSVGDVVAGARGLGIEGAGTELKLVQKLVVLTVLVLDEWLLDEPDAGFCSMMPELWRYGTASAPRSSARNTARRTGSPGSALTCAPTPSWTG